MAEGGTVCLACAWTSRWEQTQGTRRQPEVVSVVDERDQFGLVMGRSLRHCAVAGGFGGRRGV